MKVAFLVERNIFFRVFGPIIDKALEMGHQVFCFHDYSQPKTGSKGYQFPDINQTPQFNNGKVVSLDYRAESELIEKCLQNKIRAVISLDFSEVHLPIRNKLKEQGVFWFALQSGFDTGPNSGKYLSMPDKFFIYSFEWLKWMFEYLKKAGKAKEENFLAFENKLQEKIKPVGFWLAEQKMIINPSDIKRKWGIPLDKKVVLFLPFPFNSSIDRFWLKYVFGMDNIFLQLPFAFISGKRRFLKQVLRKENDRQLIKALRQFCDKNSAFLLVKSRKKDSVRSYLQKAADKILYDESFYPSTIMECMAIADLCLSFYSTAVIEAAISSVPHICIAPNIQDWKDIQTVYFQTIFDKMGDFFDFPGVSWQLSVAQALEKLAKASFSDFVLDKTQRDKYHQKFIGDLNGGYSSRIIEGIELLV